MRKVDRVVYLVIALFGVFVAFQGRQWGLILDRIPGPGFWPFWIGIAMIVVALWPLALTFFDKSESKPNPFVKKDLYSFAVIIGGGLFVAVFSNVSGMLVAIGIMTAAVSLLMGMKKLPVVIGVSIGMPLVMFLLFDLFLGVPLPRGLIG